jgi:predicted ATP-dependent endonuclease of OLD family
MADVVEGGKAHGDLSASIQTFATRVLEEKTTDERSLSGFEAELNKLLAPWQSEFKLKFPPPSASEIVKNMLGWDLFDKFHGKPQTIEYSGSGFQRHFIYSLIQLGSRYIRKKVAKKNKDFSPSMVLLLFEEPEAFLHPPQQDVLARNLMALATADNWQVLCATHSPNFVSKNTENIPAIIRLHRTASQIEKFQISVASWRAIVEANQAVVAIAEKHPKFAEKLHEDDSKPEMEVVKHFLWLNPDRCSLFFANYVLLVEGPSETALINKLLGEGKILAGDVGLYVLDCMGKYNIHRFMNLLSNLGIRHSVLHDDDNNKDEHADINSLIQNSKRPPFTQKIVRIQGNLETLLAVPPVKSPHRKPQHILYWYASGRIDGTNVQLFCDRVHDCLSQ